MSAKMSALDFSWGGAELIDRIADEVWRALHEKTIQHARREGRSVIAEADVRACLRDALDEVAAKELEATHVGG